MKDSIDFGSMDIPKLFRKLLIPTVLGMIFSAIFIITDGIFVGKGIGSDALAAVNITAPLFLINTGVALMFGIGASVVASIHLSQGKVKVARINITQAVVVSSLLLIAYAAVILCNVEKIALLLGSSPRLLPLATEYMHWFIPFLVFSALLSSGMFFVRLDGSPNYAMVCNIIPALLNIGLDYLFIFPLDMGIFGAVLATGMAPVISMLVLSMHWLKGKNRFHLQKTGMSAEMIFSILPLGFPSLITELASGIVMIAFNRIILRLQGNTGVAAYGVVANLSLVVLSIYTGIAQGMQPLVSRFYGKGDTEERNRVLKYALLTMMLLSFGIYLGIFRFAGPIAGVFNSDKNRQLEAIAVEGLRLYFTAAPFAGFNIVISMYFTSVEKAFPAQIISLLRGFLLILPLAFGLAYLAGITGVWLAFPVTEGLTAMGGVFLFRRGRSQ